jgi:excisionase family DNA binding protein
LPERPISTQDAAEQLGITNRRIEQLIHEGTIKAKKNASNRWEISAASVRQHAAVLARKPSRRSPRVLSLPRGSTQVPGNGDVAVLSAVLIEHQQGQLQILEILTRIEEKVDKLDRDAVPPRKAQRPRPKAGSKA